MTTEDAVALEPCPWCGSEGHVWENPWEEGTWEATCIACHAGIEHKLSEAEAIAAWNTRITKQQHGDDVERVARAICEADHAHKDWWKQYERHARAALDALQSNVGE